MNKQLLLSNIRTVLIRLEETIIFSLIERAQFRHNQRIYKKSEFGDALQGDSLVGYLLHQTEIIHAKMRRYTSPDEHPFYNDLPNPVLPPIVFEENPLRPNKINFNSKIREIYESCIVPAICESGDDNQYGSSAVCDVTCLQSISRRVHYGKFVAESKIRQNQTAFVEAIKSKDKDALLGLVTDQSVENDVIARVRKKTEVYGQIDHGDSNPLRIQPDVVAKIYKEWLIPLNKAVQVEYLLQRGID